VVRERFGVLLHSIRFRLVLWFTAILAVILCSFSAFLFYTQSNNLQEEAIREINRRITGLVENVQTALRQGSGQISIPNGLLRDTDVFILLSPDGQVLASQGPIPAQEAIQIVSAGLQTTPRTSESAAIYWTSPTSQNYVFIIAPVQSQMGINFPMIFGGILDPSALVRRFLLTLVAGSLLTLAIALVGGFWLADRAMRPVKTITQAARTIGETDLSRRINSKSKDELGELANTFDAMLARLQAAFERQRQFVADASHELRTPLTIVNLETSRAIASRRSPQEYQHALSIIRSENDFMTSLVNDLLMLARMDAGQTTIEKTPLDLSDVAVETVERLTPLANRNGVTLEAGNLPETRILGDRQYLLQMLSNLVENAIKYTTGDKKRVCVETGTADGCAWVRVSDTGPGIAPEHLPHLFDRFYRVDKSRTRDAGTESDPRSPTGSGLGLSIVQWIAQVHGGEVRVESTLGVGTTFEVRLKAGK
ncbi:MAG: ATP-binding protein, partial [Chloroflexi bacterium]|nr:ATP-binding protein [Chloroflexota bacterium]